MANDGVDTTRLARKVADRADRAPVMWSWAQVAVVTTTDGVPTVTIVVGFGTTGEIVYPAVRYDTSITAYPGQKVAVLWQGTDPYVFSAPAV